jgi:hypothetical protein
MFGSFPGLFAAYRVLRRLLAPRHPPYALNNLVIDARARYGVSKVRMVLGACVAEMKERLVAFLHSGFGAKKTAGRVAGRRGASRSARS